MTKLNTIFIYTPTWLEFGGGEKYILLLAEVLSNQPHVKVTLLLDEPGITESKLKNFSQTDLKNIECINIGSTNELKVITANADIFICLSNYKKITSSARIHVQLLQIPYGKINGLSILAKFISGNWKEGLKDLFRLRLLSFSRDSADLVIANSEYVNNTLQKNYGINSQTLYPPIQDYYVQGVSKKKIIISVGRFFSGLYNEKRYDILTEAFRMEFYAELKDWEYHIIGNAKNDLKTKMILSLLKEKNKTYPIYFHVNANHDTLKRIYNEAAIFWHGAGYGVDENIHPENVEHFGMTTVEAMSAKCIPVVINKGGQCESVSTGINGFLWNTIEELISYSVDIAQKKIPLSYLRDNARKRYSDFNITKFQVSVIELFSPLLN